MHFKVPIKISIFDRLHNSPATIGNTTLELTRAPPNIGSLSPGAYFTTPMPSNANVRPRISRVLFVCRGSLRNFFPMQRDTPFDRIRPRFNLLLCNIGFEPFGTSRRPPSLLLRLPTVSNLSAHPRALVLCPLITPTRTERALYTRAILGRHSAKCLPNAPRRTPARTCPIKFRKMSPSKMKMNDSRNEEKAFYLIFTHSARDVYS